MAEQDPTRDADDPESVARLRPILPPDPVRTQAESPDPETRFAPDQAAPTLPQTSDATLGFQSPGPRSTEAPADAFPGYELLETLGEGGMGVVYKARQEGLNRLVALKVILGGRRAGPKDLIRFLAEAEAVASIRHPHVVQVHEYGEVDGRPFLTLEYLPGGTLAERLKRRQRLEPREAAKLVSKLARAVQDAHDRGIVHRDLKPANVLFDAEGEPKVTDFGLAKQGKGVDLTQTQAVMGTPAYMSPEQARGQTKFVGPPADVYALGVILYECLTGLRPFHDAETHVLLRRVIEEAPASPTRHVAGLPRDLELITLKCLAKDPAERYPTAVLLALDLGHFLAGEPVSVRAAGAIERTLKWARRKPTQAIAYALTAAVLVLLTFGASVLVLWRQAEQARGIAERARDGEKTSRAAVEKAGEALARADYGRSMQVAHQEWRDNEIGACLALLGRTRPDLRGWEWDYVRRLCHGEVREFSALGDEVYSVSWSPDGSRLATAEGARARVRDVRTGGTVLELEGHTNTVSQVCWSPDGSQLATASADHSARVWDAKTGRETRILAGHTEWVHSVCWSPDGSRLATASGGFFDIPHADDTVRVWEARTGAQTLVLKGFLKWVNSVSWSPDGSRLATIGGDGSIRLFDSGTGGETLRLSGQGGSTRSSVSWSPDGSRLATTVGENNVRVRDAKTGAELRMLEGPALERRPGEMIASMSGSGFTSVSWTPDGSRLAAGGSDGTARVWDVDTRALVSIYKGHLGELTSVGWSPDGSRLATASRDKTSRVWDAKVSVEALALAGPSRMSAPSSSVSWSPDGSRVAAGRQDGLARVFDSNTGLEILTWKGHPESSISSASWSPDGSRLATASWDNTAKVWDANSGAEIFTLKGHINGVASVSWSPDGSRLATASWDNTAKVWDAKTGLEILAIRGQDFEPNADGGMTRVLSGMTSASWSPDGSRLAIACNDHSARVRDARTGADVLALKGHTGLVTSVVWSPDGSRLATASEDNTARVWDAKTAVGTWELKGHTAAVRSVGWSPDGSRLATTGDDGTVRVWDARSGTETLTLKGLSMRGFSVAWSPDGSRLATSGADNTAWIWDARSMAELVAKGGTEGRN